jgi:hypothetical protein
MTGRRNVDSNLPPGFEVRWHQASRACSLAEVIAPEQAVITLPRSSVGSMLREYSC